MDIKRKIFYRMFTKWSFSYVLISTVAIIVISFCAKKYSDVLRTELEYTNAVQLEIIQLQMDRCVQNLRTFSGKANLNGTVNRLRQKDSYEDVSRYELYELVREMENDMILGGEQTNCYIYFPAMDLLLSGGYYNNTREFYDIFMESQGFSYEDWYAVISREYKTAQIFSMETKNGGVLTVLVKPVDSSNRQSYPVNAIMVMDMNEVLRASDWLNQDRDTMCIIDRTNKKVVSNTGLKEGMEELLLSCAPGTGNKMFETPPELGQSVVSYIHSGYENWDYVAITEEQAGVSQIEDLQRFVVGLILLYLLVSVCAVIYAVLHHYLPLQNVMDILEQQADDGDSHMSSDAYEYISRSIHKLVDKNKKSTNVITMQKNAISKELFHRLLTEDKAESVLDDELLKQYGILVGDKSFCLLAYEMGQEEKTDMESYTADTLEMSWFILQNVTEENLVLRGLNGICFREGIGKQVFLIWSDQESAFLQEDVRGALQISLDFIQENFKFSYCSALSEIHEGTSKIYKAYREVLRVFEYQKKEGKAVVSYGEINLLPMDTMLKYPIDVENRLIHSVSIGDAHDACRAISLLLEKNQVNCLTPEAMQFLVSNIAATIIRTAAKTSGGNFVHASRRSLMEACRQGDTTNMRKELERLVTDACREIAELQNKECENQKGIVYLDTKAYVEENYMDAALSVNSMADQFHMSANYLSKVFKEVGGEKLSQYIHKVRLIHAKELLMTGVKLDDITIRCGFGSQRTFLRIFKQYEGVTPTQFRELEEQKGKEEQTI